ncbi:PQQ-binding-like beta-propeller repeat protein [Microbacterium sp. 2P01SA-2]|uniref:outer membrane protein assembly factor BamB family protein n=1 Tax=unclassified Microbacterium TaxID=2609290 RepID=UPI0039A1783D
MGRAAERTGRARRPTVGAGLLAVAALLASGCTPAAGDEAFSSRWETTFDVSTRVVASGEGVVIVASDEGQTLAALNTRNGGTRWSLPFTPMPSAVTVRGDVVTVQQRLDSGVHVSAISASTGNPMWTRTANGGSVIGAFSDGRVATVRDDTVSISDVANVRTAEPWMPHPSCSVGTTQLSPGKDPWLAVLELCDDGPSHLIRLDDSLREVWRTPTATAARFDFIDGLVAASDDGANLTIVGDDGAIVQTLAGYVPPGSAVVHRTFEDDVVAVSASGELHPAAGYLRVQNDADLAVLSVVRVGDGPDTTFATAVGHDGALTPLTGDDYLLARQLGGTTVLTLWRWQTAGTPPDDIRSWPDTFAVDAGSAGRMTAVAIGDDGDLDYTLVDEAGGTRFASVRVAVVASAASARTAFELATSTDAAATSPTDAATTVHRDDGTVTAIRGSCLLALRPDGDPLAAADEAALLDAVFAAETSGACDE